MQVIDLSHPISRGMPVYPGTAPPVISQGSTFNKDGFLEQKLTLFTHTGTHIDAPAHILENGRTLDGFPADHFCGRGNSIPLMDIRKNAISIEDLSPYENQIRESDFVLLNTGWSRWWGDDRYFKDYPVLSIEAAKWLGAFALKGVGLDTISADPILAENWPVHRVFLKKDIIIIENLTNLNALARTPFTFSCLPLKIIGADGSPVRAVAFLQD